MSSADQIRVHIAALTDSDIMKKVGPATWGKGLRDYTGERVLDMTDTPEGKIRGRVRGPGLTYSAWVALDTTKHHLNLTCACPLGQDCRHAVALTLAIRDAERRATEKAAESHNPNEQATHIWRRCLTDLVGSPSGAQGQPMGLLVDTSDPQHIIVSPLRQGQRVDWTTKRASWADITTTQWESVTLDLNPTHVALLREGYAIAHQGNQWKSRNDVSLNDLGEKAWEWLCSLQRSGMTLLGSLTPPEPLHLSPELWEICCDVSLSEEALTLRSAATHKDQSRSAACINTDTHLIVLQDRYSLARIAVNEAYKKFSSQQLKIPLRDIPEFHSQWLPILTSYIPVISTDNTWNSESITHIHVIATLRTDTEGNIVIRWWSEYEIAGQSFRSPLESQVKDPELSRIISTITQRGRALCPPDLWEEELRERKIPGWEKDRYMNEVVARIQDPHLTWDISQDIHKLTLDSPEALTLRVHLEDSETRDWFDLRATIDVYGYEISLSEILTALNNGEEHVYSNGHWVSLHHPKLEYLQELIAAAELLTQAEAPAPALRMIHVGLWNEIEELADYIEVSDEWQQRVAALRTENTAEASLKPLPHIADVLRPYQIQGHEWLTSRALLGLGGILADDMGLGKTMQMLSAFAAICARVDTESRRPILVVAPTSVVPTWRNEAQRFFPQLAVETITSTRQVDKDSIKETTADIVVMSYTIMRLNAEIWAQHQWGGLVLDEAQATKNPTTAIYRALRKIHTPWCFAVTGTPVENSLTDLWSLLSLTCPGLLPARKIFDTKIRRPIENGDSSDVLTHLHALTQPFILRRTKEEVAEELPEKSMNLISLQLGEEHQHIYDQYLMRERAQLLGLMDDFNSHRMDILASITRLRQLALDPALVDPALSSVGSAKIEFLTERLDEIIPRGHRVLIFSQFTSFLLRIRQAVERRGYQVVQLDGGTRHREEVIQRFREGEAPVFLISLKAGGTGLTLTEADYVFLMDPWWNPAAEEQAIDRAHRIGQTKKVHVYRLAASGTIEEKVVALQEKKRKLVSAVVDGGASGARITMAELKELIGVFPDGK
ncbi:DEAD/DEAH box helicase [Schaalia sp. lx-100]|uniref:DEAD/DEAH box helicase n=1 Tax=Schaalia sp. lx-100 TaxID=2899081 RepID=UPI001E55B5C3|nr:DEAD/DEAH box helicase [Schaalia sp. lx-100]MCD4556642.1 DEAD/DEAH box helicase [Schaalia sp. lx-100]